MAIHIKESRRGTFTAAAHKHHEGVQEFAHTVEAHPDDYSKAMSRKAVFAENAKHWHHNGGRRHHHQ